MPNLCMAYIIPFLRLITISLSSLGSSVYLQNIFCQSYWCIIHWHQWAYFHFNNTEIFFNIMWFCIDLCDRMKAVWRWSNSRLFQVTSPPSICQSHSREGEGMREHYNWREFLQNNAKSLTFPAPPHPPWRCVRIQRLSQYPKAASRSNNELAPPVLSPVIFTMFWSSASDHSQPS